VPETPVSTRRWNGYVCPGCRFVFRVARDHAGPGLICPGCHQVLRLPSPDEKPPQLVVPLPARQLETTMHRRRRKPPQGTDEDWETEDEHGPDDDGQAGRQMTWLLAAGAAILILSIVAVTRAMLGNSNQSAATPASAAAPVNAGANDVRDAGDFPASNRISDRDFLRLAKPLADRFLSATTIDGLLPLLREPGRAEPRLRAHYKDQRIDPQGLDIFDTRSSVVRTGAFLSINIRTKTLEEKTMSFANTDDGLKIDWESWVGWSAMPWEDFLAGKPSAPTLFRVILRPVDYYNFGFSDDDKWRSYRLDSPRDGHSLYGYVERGTIADSMIQLPPEAKAMRLTLLLSFPDGIESRNQVRIDRVAAEGWLLENEDPEP
jgi:hypothetical protein